MSRGDLPALEKKLVTNFREGKGSPVETEWGFLAGCLLFVSWLRMEAHLSRGKGGRGRLLELRGLGAGTGLLSPRVDVPWSLKKQHVAS